LVKNELGETIDVGVEDQSDYTEQMLYYSEKFGFLSRI